MPHYIQIRKYSSNPGIFLVSPHIIGGEMELDCELDVANCTDATLEEWARKESANYGDCDICDDNGTWLLRDGDPDNRFLDDPAYGLLYVERR